MAGLCCRALGEHVLSSGYTDALRNGRVPQCKRAAGDVVDILKGEARVTTGDVLEARRLLGGEIRLEVAESL